MNDNKRGFKVQNAKCEMGIAIVIVNVDMMPSCTRFPPSLYLFSPPLQPLSLLLSSACPAMSEWQLCSVIPELHTVMSEWQLSSALASFSLLADYPSIKLTSKAWEKNFSSM